MLFQARSSPVGSQPDVGTPRIFSSSHCSSSLFFSLLSIVFSIVPHCSRHRAFFLACARRCIVIGTFFPLQIDCISFQAPPGVGGKPSPCRAVERMGGAWQAISFTRAFADCPDGGNRKPGTRPPKQERDVQLVALVFLFPLLFPVFRPCYSPVPRSHPFHHYFNGFYCILRISAPCKSPVFYREGFWAAPVLRQPKPRTGSNHCAYGRRASAESTAPTMTSVGLALFCCSARGSEKVASTSILQVMIVLMGSA